MPQDRRQCVPINRELLNLPSELVKKVKTYSCEIMADFPITRAEQISLSNRLTGSSAHHLNCYLDYSPKLA